MCKHAQQLAPYPWRVEEGNESWLIAVCQFVPLQEEEIRRAAEEKQRLEDEEAAKWMNMISVQDTVRAAWGGGLGGGSCSL